MADLDKSCSLVSLAMTGGGIFGFVVLVVVDCSALLLGGEIAKISDISKRAM